jgi:hypothetical protein
MDVLPSLEPRPTKMVPLLPEQTFAAMMPIGTHIWYKLIDRPTSASAAQGKSEIVDSSLEAPIFGGAPSIA